MHPTTGLQVGILGSLEVRTDQGALPLAGARLRRLLLRLAVDAGSAVSPAELLDAVWPDGELRPDGATNALQSLVSRLRRALGHAGAVLQLPGGYGLAVERADVDAHRFLSLAARGRRELRQADAESALATLGNAMGLWRGAALADADDASYAAAVIARLEEQRLRATTDLFDAHIALGRAAEVVGQLEELATSDLLREDFTGQLMTALSVAGRTAEALMAYERLRARLAGELGMDPSPKLQAQHLALLRGQGRPEGPAPVARRSAPPRLTNIRSALTSFIGREVELVRIEALLAAGRLTTIIGPGGAGKTRLAATAAAAQQERCPDGVWMIELAPVTDGADIAQAMLGALGLMDTMILDRRTDRTARDSVERLFEALQNRSTLLVVDNCEHLIVPVAELLEAILTRCPAVQVLATSREPLGIVGESLCVIPPLGLPPLTSTAVEAVGYPAVRLLADRAGAVSVHFRVDDANVAAVIEIVRRLDGLPLAIELAAARLRVLPVGEIAARLGDRFRLLTGGNRTAMPRHRTLRAVVEWSWDLLTPAETLLAERLSVFPAGTTEAAALEICGDGRLDAADIPDLLLSLVDKSLLQVVDSPGLRYRMLETIREYGVERLAERSEADPARAAHADHFEGLVGRLEPVVRSSGQLEAIATLDAEQDNIAAAIRFLGDSGAAQRAATMTLACLWHWSMTERQTEIITWMDYLLGLPGIEQSSLVLYLQAARAVSMLQSGLAQTSRQESDLMAEFAVLAEALVTAPPPPWAGLIALGPVLSFFSGHHRSGTLMSQELLRSPDPWIRATIRTMRASFHENNGDLEEMRIDADAALRDFEVIGDRWGLATTLNSRAWIRTMDGDSPGAVRDYERALDCLHGLGSNEDDQLIHLRLSGLRMRMGDLEGARASLVTARGDVTAVGPQAVVVSLFVDGAEVGLRLMEGDREGALALCADLRRRVAERGDSPWMRGHLAALTLGATAKVALQVGDLEQAIADVVMAYPVARESVDMPIVATVGVSVAGVAMRCGQTSRSAVMLGASARLRGGDDLTDPSTHWLVGELREALGPAFDAAYAAGKALSVEACLDALDPRSLHAE